MILLVAVEAARFASGERVQWRPAATVLAGVCLGWALHPNSLNLWRFNWIHMVDVLFKNAWQSKEGIELGPEFLPFTAEQWLRWLLGAVAMVVTGLVMGWRNRRNDSLLLAFAFAATVFWILTGRTARFAEYFILFSAAAMALASRLISWRWCAPAVFAAVLLYSGVPLSETLHGLGTKTERIPPQLASSLQQQIPVGSQVFTTEWGHTGTLMLALSDRRFIVALDPTLFLVENPELYRIWYNLPRHPYPGIAEVIRQRFGARYVISFWDERFSKFYYTLASEPGVKTLLISDMWMVYDLGGGNAGIANVHP